MSMPLFVKLALAGLVAAGLAATPATASGGGTDPSPAIEAATTI